MTTRHIPFRTLAPALKSARMLVTLAPRDMGMFRFLLEAYDNLALFTVLDPGKATVKLIFSPHQRKDVEKALQAVNALVPLSAEEYPWD